MPLRTSKGASSSEDWNFISLDNNGDEVEGILVSRKDSVGRNEKTVYLLAPINGGTLTAVWATDILIERMREVEVDDAVNGVVVGARVILRGLGKPPGKRYYNFEVSVYTDENGNIEIFDRPSGEAKTVSRANHENPEVPARKPAVKPAVKTVAPPVKQAQPPVKKAAVPSVDDLTGEDEGEEIPF